MSKASQRKQSAYAMGFDDVRRGVTYRLIPKAHYKDYMAGRNDAIKKARASNRKSIVDRLRDLSASLLERIY